MATLTPGLLLKLLQSMHTDARVTSEHRSAVLQVIGIVPALTASTADALWPSHGFFVQLSDSLHSTYVQLSPADADAVLSSRSQLGQLVHVDRLAFARPVPRAVGLRPVPSSRPIPCIGSPEPLVARTAACSRGFVIQPASPSDAGPPLMPSNPAGAPAPDADAVKRTVLAPKNQPEMVAAPAVKRRFSSPASAKQRDPSPGLRAPSPSFSSGKGGSRPSSPAPSKCVVPSLAAAKEENRRTAREPAIIVPSRYRQPSPAGGRRSAASPVGGRRASLSPGARRLSGEGGSKKKVGVVVAGISKMADVLNGSAVKPGRKSWDESSMVAATSSVLSLEGKEKSRSRNRVDKDAILRTQEAMSRRLSDAATEQSSNDDSSIDEKPKPRKKIDSTSEKVKIAVPKITLHDPKWTDGSIPFDAVSDKLSKIGKEALERRDAVATAAAEALQEALVTESLIRNLSVFSDLCSSSKASNPLPTIDRFLVVYNDTLKWRKIIESVATSGADEAASLEKSASRWVSAALATDLEVLKLLNTATDSISRKKSTDKPKVPSVDPPRTSLSKRQSLGTSAKGHSSKVSPSPAMSSTWSKVQGMNETLEFAKTLRREMQMWFLKFVDEALDVGFLLFGDQSSNRGRENSNSAKDSGRITAVLSQFKRINDWLDGVGKIAEEEEATKDRIERLKRKIYGFVISHMGSAFESSVSLSSKS